MTTRLPEQRQFGHVWFTRTDAFHLRDEIRKAIEEIDTDGPIKDIAARLFEALLRLTLEDIEGINVELDGEECIFINALVVNHAWPTSDDLLVQTWQVLHENLFGEPFVPQAGPALELPPMAKGGTRAVHRTVKTPAPQSGRQPRRNTGGAELPA